jgi:glutamyl-tRNA synthetase
MPADSSVRVRFAPSPTGWVHPGTVRTALFNYLFARRHQGTFILRIEDTDQKREVEGSVAVIMDALRWLGLAWDEGPDVGGPVGPYVQSERLPSYTVVAEEAIARGQAYRCFCTPERLEAMRREQQARREPPRYDRTCRDLAADDVRARLAAGLASTVRQRIPDGERITITDLIHGTLHWDSSTLDDHVLLKSDGWPTYHLGQFADDHAMRISHIVRGDEWLPSLPKHWLLWRGMGVLLPPTAHTPAVLGRDGKKLSKRQGAASVLEYRDQGYLPEAVVNFLAFLGWSPGTEEELFTLTELSERFSFERVSASPAVLNPERLDWLNGQHLRRLPNAELAACLEPFLPGVMSAQVVPLLPLVRERMQRLTDAGPLLAYFFEEPEYPSELLVPDGHSPERAAGVLRAARERLQALDALEPEACNQALRQVAAEAGWKAGDVFMLLRIAITGRKVSPPLLESFPLLGRERVLARLTRAQEKLAASQK